MIDRLIFMLLLFLAACTTVTQDLASINKEIQVIDSLIVFSQYELVEKKADSLYFIIRESNLREQILKVRLQKAIAIDAKNEYDEALAMYLEILSEAKKHGFNKIICEIVINISLIHEKNNDLLLAYTYIKKALESCKKFSLDEFYSRILIRVASIHRVAIRTKISPEQTKKLAKLGCFVSLDSTMQYAQQAIPYAQKYNKYQDLNDAYFLIGTYYSSRKEDKLAVEYFLKILPYVRKLGKNEGMLLTYNNISKKYLSINNTTDAIRYNDSSYQYYNKVTFVTKFVPAFQRSEIFAVLNKPDSAYHYLKIAFNEKQTSDEKQKEMDTRKTEEKYQNEKKEEIIRTKNQQIIFFVFFVGVILVAILVVLRKNRQIASQNKVINQQVEELKKVVTQKQILLSELQHRVKNNLQYVISILEIQKESASFNNIEELIRSNQNRVHSIALLHKKLNVTDSVNDTDLKRYITDLAELVKDSYDTKEKKVSLFLTCEVDSLPITKALPLGLIVVELVSNSMKHAFNKQPNGIISIEITYNDHVAKNCLHYIDNGVGFDLEHTITQGLGIEIMRGLIDQLNGNMEVQSKNGFELKMYFR